MKSSLLPVALIATAQTLAGCHGGSPHESPPIRPSQSSSATSAISVTSTPTPTLSSAPALASSAPVRPIPDKLNVLLISVDSLRADMPWTGYPRSIAPRLQQLEAKAVSYTQAYAISSYTSMSVGGFLAGEYPSSMKRDGYFFGTYAKDNLMFPERLHAAGVRTLAAHAHRYFAASAGFGQGFDVWEMVPGIKFDPQTDPNVTGPKHEELAERILGDPKNTTGQFFAWFHFMDPHDVYVRHKDITPWGNSGRDLYDGEVQFTDAQVGKLLDFVERQPWASKTAIIVTSDHGEAFGEHGVYRHGFELFQELVRVPWFFVVPGVEPHRIVQPRSHLDLAPTILALMGVGTGEAPLRGKSLLPEILRAEAPEPRDVLIDLPRTSDNDRRRGLISGKLKLIAYADDSYFRLFDLEADPQEQHDLRERDAESYKRLVLQYRKSATTIKEVRPYACRTLKGAPKGRDY